jgi:hypothetical protein
LLTPIDRYFVRILIWVLAAGCMLNLNGVGVMVIGINQLFSPFILLSASLLIIFSLKNNTALSSEMLLYMFSIFIYLTISGMVGLVKVSNNIDAVSVLLFRYFSAMIVVIASYYSVLLAEKARLKPLYVLLILCAVASFFIPFGSMLNISGKIIVDSNRGAGLFGNPNEAGIVSAMGFAISLILIKKKWLLICLVCFFVSMSVLTFSKTGLLMMVLIYFINLFLSGSLVKGFSRVLSAIIIIYTLLILFSGMITAQFEGTKAKRMSQFFDIVLLKPADDVVESSRGYLWRQGIDKIKRNIFFGEGLGALHSMKGGNLSVNNKVAQGVHNTYLLKYGDGGIIVFIVFMYFLFIVSKRSMSLSRNNPYARVAFLYFMIFSLDCISSHNVELLRFHNYLLGFSLALLYLAKREYFEGRSVCAV